MAKYKLDIIDIDTRRYEILSKMFDVNMKELSFKLGFTESYIGSRIAKDLINLKDVFLLKQHVGEELFNKGLEKLALIEIMQERNKGYRNRSKYQIARHISELSDLVLEQKEELERIKDLLEDWNKDFKPNIKIKNFAIPEFVEEYEKHEKEQGLSDEDMSYANFLELVKEFDKNELRELFKDLGFSKNDELAIMLHYLKNNGLNEVVQMVIEKMVKIKKDNLEKEQFVEKIEIAPEKIEIQPIQTEISEEILESPVSPNSENIENSQFTILNEEPKENEN
jgi:predicted kinase